MTLDEYQEKALKTAMYKDKIHYPALKLLGESGEVCEKLGKILRDQNRNFTDENKRELAKELGDVMWYVAVLTHDVGFKLSEYGQRRKEENVNKLFADDDIFKLSIRMMSLTSWVSMKAAVINYTIIWQQDVACNAGSVIEFIQRIGYEIGYDLDEIMEMNIGKLQSRFIRRKIKGSGDNR